MRLGNLTTVSRDASKRVWDQFDWPASIPLDMPWYSYDLLSCLGTNVIAAMSPDQILALSRAELNGFFSLNVHGIRLLLEGIAQRLHRPETPDDVSEYLHHLLDEENRHMWMFAAFCRRYGGGIAPNRMSKLATPSDAWGGDESFFGRVLVFERFVDRSNKILAEDETLPQIVREVNAAHRADEARHLVFGEGYFGALLSRVAPERRQEVIQYLGRYCESIVKSLCVGRSFESAEVVAPYVAARSVLASEAYAERLAATVADMMKPVLRSTR
jgi:hypothetical protein